MSSVCIYNIYMCRYLVCLSCQPFRKPCRQACIAFRVQNYGEKTECGIPSHWYITYHLYGIRPFFSYIHGRRIPSVWYCLYKTNTLPLHQISNSPLTGRTNTCRHESLFGREASEKQTRIYKLKHKTTQWEKSFLTENHRRSISPSM